MKGTIPYKPFNLNSTGHIELLHACYLLGFNFTIETSGRILESYRYGNYERLKPLLFTDLYLYHGLLPHEVVLFHSTDSPLVTFTKPLVTLNLEDLSSEKLKHFITVIKLMRR